MQDEHIGINEFCIDRLLNNDSSISHDIYVCTAIVVDDSIEYIVYSVGKYSFHIQLGQIKAKFSQ